MNRADVLASDCIHLRCGHAYSKGYQHTNLNDDSGVVVIRCTVCGATWQWGCICVDTDSEGDMSNKDKAAQDVNRAAQAGQQPDLTQMMTLLIQQ